MKKPDSNIVTKYLQNSIVSDGPMRGGLRDSFQLRNKQFDFIYTETTGYAVTYFSNLARQGNPQAKTSAISCADFLAEHMTDEGLPYTYPIGDGQPDQRHYAFDNAICLSGLVDIYQLTHDTKYLEAAQRIIRWLRLMYLGDDNFYSCLDTTSGIREHSGMNFADDRGCLHVKNVIGILKLADTTNDSVLRKWATDILDAGLSRQISSGAFPVQRNVATIFSHAHSYISEGYLYAYLRHKNESYLAAVERSAKYLSGVQAWNGGVFQYNRRGVRASDATAQAIRIWIILDQLHSTNFFSAAIRRANAYLARMQYIGSEEVTGSILYTLSPFFRRAPVAYSWVGMFTGSAMSLLQRGVVDAQEIY